jgi:hypothetical protein
MNRRRGRRSTRRDIDELIAEIRQARIEWDALPLEERIRRGRGDGHSTPDFRWEQSPGGPFAAWAQFESSSLNREVAGRAVVCGAFVA